MPTNDTTTKLPSGPKMAEAILEAEGRPMHVKLIAERVIAKDQARPKKDRAYNGKTPAATISAQLTTSHVNGKTFIRVSPGCFGLRAWTAAKLKKAPLKPEGLRQRKAEPTSPAPDAPVTEPALDGVDPKVAAASTVISEGGDAPAQTAAKAGRGKAPKGGRGRKAPAKAEPTPDPEPAAA
jgi:hypothetical protein